MATPFLKWAGGKRRLLPEIVALLPVDFKKRLYCEPFVGGGAVFFHLADQIGQAYLNDRNVALIATYKAVQQYPDRVLQHLERLAQRNTAADFQDIRAQYNGSMQGAAASAAAFIYLNKTCFNGLYRVNRRGHFNVPFGSYKNPRIFDEPGLREASAALQRADLQHVDFTRVVCTRPAFIYVDPPYPQASKTADFTQYTAKGFAGWAPHELLRDRVRLWVDRGHKVLLSYPDTPAVRALYEGFYATEVQGPRSVAANGDRKPVAELLLRNYDL